MTGDEDGQELVDLLGPVVSWPVMGLAELLAGVPRRRRRRVLRAALGMVETRVLATVAALDDMGAGGG